MLSPTEAIQTSDHLHGINKDQMMLLALSGKGATAIGKELGCTKSYVSQILKPYRDEIKAYLLFKQDPQTLWELREYQALNSINTNKLKEASPRDQVTIAGIARDKVNIFTGKAPLEAENLVFNVVYNDNRVIGSSKTDESTTIDITPPVDKTPETVDEL